MASSNTSSAQHIFQGMKYQLKNLLDGEDGPGTIELLGNKKSVADDSVKFHIRDGKGCVFAVGICSSAISPGLVARGVDIAAEVRKTLKSELAKVILEPLKTGELNGLTYHVLPYCVPLSDKMVGRFRQRRFLQSRVFDWLQQVTKDSMLKPDADEIRSDFLVPLEQIRANHRLSRTIRESASFAIERLASGRWKPRYVLAHNDFWDGNLLLQQQNQQDNDFGFIVIDWPGAIIKGHAIYDLIRMSRSLKLGRKRLLQELQQHCKILDCKLVDSSGYLLASLGFLGMNLGHFPMDNYIRLTEGCYQYLEKFNQEAVR